MASEFVEQLSLFAGRMSRQDAWRNRVTGLGGQSDNTRETEFDLFEKILTDDVLCAMYDNDWLTQAAIRAVVDDSLREQFSISNLDAGEDQEDTLTLFDECNTNARYPEGALVTGLKFGRLMGGYHLVLGIDGAGAPDSDLAPYYGNRPMAIRWIEPLRYTWLQVLSRYEDQNRPKCGEPEVWRISTGPRRGLDVHESRVITCEGISRASIWSGQIRMSQRPWNSGILPLYKTLANFGMSWQAIAHLIQEASIGVMTMAGLIEMLNQEDQSVIDKRAELLSMTRSVARTIMLDADGKEAYTRTAVSFADLPNLMREQMYQISGALETPASRLFGLQVAGLSQSGDADQQAWGGRVKQFQKQRVTPKVQRILTILRGKPTTIAWPPIWTQSAKDAEAARLNRAQADQIWYQLGVITPQNILESRVADESLGVSVDVQARLAEMKIEAAQAEADAQAQLEAQAAKGVKNTKPNKDAEPQANKSEDLNTSAVPPGNGPGRS